jgi:hypothetical protein
MMQRKSPVWLDNALKVRAATSQFLRAKYDLND